MSFRRGDIVGYHSPLLKTVEQGVVIDYHVNKHLPVIVKMFAALNTIKYY